jgi:hypothetical protein
MSTHRFGVSSGFSGVGGGTLVAGEPFRLRLSRETTIFQSKNYSKFRKPIFIAENYIFPGNFRRTL